MTLPAAPTTAARPVAQTPLHLSERDGKRRGGARPAAARGLTAGEWTAACWRSLLGSVCGERGAIVIRSNTSTCPRVAQLAYSPHSTHRCVPTLRTQHTGVFLVEARSACLVKSPARTAGLQHISAFAFNRACQVHAAMQ